MIHITAQSAASQPWYLTPTWYQVIVTVIIGILTFVITRRFHKYNQVHSAYSLATSAIIEMKTWAAKKESKLLPLIEACGIYRDLKQKEIVASPQELLAICTLFYHLERVYLMLEQSPRSMKLADKEGYYEEIRLWLGLGKMKEFYREFWSVSGTHSKQFKQMCELFFSASGRKGCGNITYQVDANTGQARSGKITIDGISYDISQEDGRLLDKGFQVTPPTCTQLNAAGGSLIFNVKVGDPNYEWSSSSDVPWVRLLRK